MDPDIGTALITALAAVLGWLVGRMQLRHSDEQMRLGAAAFAADWFRDFRAWACDAIDVLSEASYVSERAEDTQRYRHRLSALIDQGRFFLPNTAHEDYGLNKPSAYRGHRQRALDYLVEAERVLGGHRRAEYAAFGSSPKEILFAFRREFVSAVHDILDPRARNRELSALLQRSALSGSKRAFPESSEAARG